MLFGLDANNKKDNRWAAWEYLPVTNSEEILGDLLAKYWKGLLKPIHFFPASSWRFAHSVAEKKMPVEQAEEIARSIWNGNDYIPGESRGRITRSALRNQILLIRNSESLRLKYSTRF